MQQRLRPIDAILRGQGQHGCRCTARSAPREVGPDEAAAGPTSSGELR
jgi:hypothetical protein